MSWSASELSGIAADQRARLERGNLQAWIDAYAALEAKHAEALSTTAGIQAVRRTAEAVIRLHWPSHPLFVEDVKRRVFEAGERTWALTKDWDAVVEAGTTFRLPEFDYAAPFVGPLREQCAALEVVFRDQEQQIRVLRERAEQAESQLAEANKQVDMLEGRVTALRSIEERLQKGFLDANKDCCQHMAQSAAFRAQLEFADPANPLVTDAGLRRRLADAAWDTLMQSNGDWNAVRELGRSFLSQREASRHSADVPGDVLLGEVGDDALGESAGELQVDSVDSGASDVAPVAAVDVSASDAAALRSGD